MLLAIARAMSVHNVPVARDHCLAWFHSCRRLTLVLSLTSVCFLSACASLPSSGPTAHQVVRSVSATNHQGLDYQIVDIDAQLALAPPSSNRLPQLQLEALAASSAPQRTDIIRAGDTLTIDIFEVGVTLFGNVAGASADVSPTANAQRIVVLVKDNGTIDLPYLGTLKVAGSTPQAFAGTIKQRLRKYSESPEALVTITETVENVAYVGGSVAKPGRYRLSSARERLLDLVALSGGSTLDYDDAELRLVRGDRSAEVALSQLLPEDLANIVVAPGDRIEIRRQRKTFTVFGASDRVAQMPFETQNVTLAEAIARAGGPSDSRANPRGIFLFRFEANGSRPPLPVIYRIDLLDAQSYFIAQRFQVRDKDVLLFTNAPASAPIRFIGLLNQLFSPVATAAVLTQQIK